MRTALRKIGNSTGMIVPQALLEELGSKAGEPFEVSVDRGRIVAVPADRPQVRAGWADAAAEIGAEQQGDIAAEAELKALAAELHAAADRMGRMLDEAIASLREANDPGRDELFRKKALAELNGETPILDFSGLAA